jgi:ribosome-associated toxin RatA of RatAB toxin-antitoxin module
MFSKNHKNLSQIHEKTQFALFSLTKKKWSLTDGKDSVVIDFKLNWKMNSSIIHGKKDMFCCFNKTTKNEVFYMEKENLYYFSENNKNWSLVRGNNSVDIDFHKKKKIEV